MLIESFIMHMGCVVCEVGTEFFVCDIHEGISSEGFFWRGGGGISCFLLSNLFPEVVWF